MKRVTASSPKDAICTGTKVCDSKTTSSFPMHLEYQIGKAFLARHKGRYVSLSVWDKFFILLARIQAENRGVLRDCRLAGLLGRLSDAGPGPRTTVPQGARRPKPFS